MEKKTKRIILVVFGAFFIFAVSIGIIIIWEMNNFTPIDAFQYGPDCKVESTCNDLIGLDCNAAADGPFYYINKKSKQVIARCGGYCDGRECTNCPPDEWSCN